MKKNYLILLLSSIAILLAYLVTTHPFEIPDEQSHYATTHFLVEEGRTPTMKDTKNLSMEEHKTEEIFGIMSEGQNKYSYHPEFRLEYTNQTIGKFEEEIKSFNTKENRSTYTIHQAALYPPLYYWFTSIFYRLVEKGDILLRLFTSRLAALIITSFIPLIAYLVGKMIFKEKFYARALALLTLFFPMTAYVGVGINSDNLHNLLFGISLLLFLKLIKNGWSKNLSLSIGTVIGLDLITKPQAYILFPIFFFAILVRGNFKEWKTWFKNIPYVVLPILAIAGWQEIPKFIFGNSSIGQTAYKARVVLHGGPENFRIYTSAFFKTLLSEMVVWYWGVFKWFGVIMPRLWWWLANRLVAISFLGLGIKLFKDIKNKKITWQSKVIIFSVLANLTYMLALFWFDWQFYQEYGRSLGLQARYYLPLLITQMALIMMGLLELGWSKKIKDLIIKGLVTFFLLLQLISLYTQISSYYDILPLKTLLTQMSQYKPFFAKGAWWYLWIPLYFSGITSLTVWTLRSKK